MQPLSKILRDARLAHGLTQRQVSYKSGVSWMTISRIEHNKSCTLETLSIIAAGMDCDLVIEFRDRQTKTPITYRWPEKRKS